jgi:hypothetical protein
MRRFAEMPGKESSPSATYTCERKPQSGTGQKPIRLDVYRLGGIYTGRVSTAKSPPPAVRPTMFD